MSKEPQQSASLNRRKEENRWRRILRDADRDQYQPVRRWLRLAKEAFGSHEKEDDDTDSDPRSKAA